MIIYILIYRYIYIFSIHNVKTNTIYFIAIATLVIQRQPTQLKLICYSRFISIPVWVQLSTDGNYSWKVFPRQVFACILQHFIDFIHVGCSQLCLLSLDTLKTGFLASQLILYKTYIYSFFIYMKFRPSSCCLC